MMQVNYDRAPSGSIPGGLGFGLGLGINAQTQRLPPWRTGMIGASGQLLSTTPSHHVGPTSSGVVSIRRQLSDLEGGADGATGAGKTRSRLAGVASSSS